MKNKDIQTLSNGAVTKQVPIAVVLRNEAFLTLEAAARRRGHDVASLWLFRKGIIWAVFQDGRVHITGTEIKRLQQQGRITRAA